jgi:uncharacterized protein
MQSSEFTSPHRPYTLYLVAMVLLVTVGTFFQALFGLHLGVIASQVFIILGVALVYRGVYAPRQRHHWPEMRSLGMSVPMIFLVMLTAIVIGLTANILGALTIELIPPLQEQARQYQETVRRIMLDATPLNLALGIIAVTIAAPICEEILFRGTILPEQRRHETAAKAIVLNGLLFSVMHLNPMFLLSLAIIGAFLAHLTVKTGSIWPAIIGHFAINGFNGVVLPRIAPEAAFAAITPSLQEILTALALLAPIAALLWWMTMKRLGAAPSPRVYETGHNED